MRVRRAVVALTLPFAMLPACTASRGGNAPSTSVVTESRFAALWPEQTLAAAMEAQAALEAGQGDLGWRLDPRATAQRFAVQILGWDGSLVVKDERWTLSSGIEIAREWLCDPGGCPPTGAAFDQEIVLKRLAGAGEDGVWSVTDVTSERLMLDEGPSIRIRDPLLKAGKRLSALARNLPDGTKVVAGSAVVGRCGTVVDSSTPTVRFSRVRFQVATTLDGPCAKATRPTESAPGYVFVLPRTRGVNVSPATMFGQPRPAGTTPIPDLTALAVRFTSRDRVPPPPASWLSRDPATLPRCRSEQLAVEVSAGEGVPGGGVGVLVEVRRRHVAACHAELDLKLRLFDAGGQRIRVPGPHRIHLEGYLPGYIRGSRTASAGWALFDWCGRSLDGPVRVRIRVAGRSIALWSNQLAMWCPSRTGSPHLEEVPLAPRPSS